MFRVSCFQFRVSCSEFQGFVFRVSGFEFRFPGFGFRVSGKGFWVTGFVFRVPKFGFRVPDFEVSIFGFRVSTFWCLVSGFGFRVSSSGCRVSGFGLRVSCFGSRVPGFGCQISNSRFRFRVLSFRFRVQDQRAQGASSRLDWVRRILPRDGQARITQEFRRILPSGFAGSRAVPPPSLPPRDGQARLRIRPRDGGSFGKPRQGEELFARGGGARRVLLQLTNFSVPLSSRYGTFKTVKARFWPSVSDKGP